MARAARVSASKKQELGVGRIVVSSRIRLARNLRGEPFPDWAKPAKRVALAESLLKKMPLAGKAVSRKLECVTLQKDNLELFECLVDYGMISQALIERGKGAAVAYGIPHSKRRPEVLSVMINEEDHIRIQVVDDAYELDRIWASANAFDNELAKHVDYAFSSRLGYLTACPSNVGTGLRASVQLYLPGLLLLNEFDAVQRAVTQLRFNVRGLAGEGSSLSSGLVQISTGGTLGLSEAQAIGSLKHVVDEVIALESNARSYILTYRRNYLEDYVGRALGILKGAKLICYDEALSCLHALRLGRELCIYDDMPISEIDGLIDGIGNGVLKRVMLTVPIHPSSYTPKAIPPGTAPNRFNDEFDKIDTFRAQLIAGAVL